MKKVFKNLLSVIMVAAMIMPIFSGFEAAAESTTSDGYCSVDAAHTTHSYELVYEKKATCTTAGYREYFCPGCGGSYIEKYGDATGHSYYNTVVKPTCTAQGYTLVKCRNCTDNYKENYVPATGHTYVYTAVKPTCTAEGYTLVTCKNCSFSSKERFIPAVGHIWNPWVVEKAATVTATGLKKHTCSVCGIVESEIIPKANHTHNYVISKTIDSTCAAEGSKTYKCSVCGDSYSETIAKKSHSYVRHAVDPTCTEDGYVYYTCKNCNGTFSTSVKTPATGHSFGAWVVTKAATVSATGTKQRTCSKCGKIETQTIPKIAHTHSYSLTKTVPATCQKEGSKVYTCSCGTSYTEVIAKTGHSFVRHVADPTCTEDGYVYYTCKTCDGVFTTSAKTPATGHSFSAWKVIKAATDKATGTKQRTCSKCGKVETQTIPMIAHTHSYSLTKTVPATCQKEGSKIYTCSCGASYTEVIAKTEHSYVRHSVDPTCTEEGYVYYTCKNCNGTFSTSAKTPATGHSFGAWVVTKAATVSATGIKQRTCSKCGMVEKQTIPMLKPQTVVTLNNHNISLNYKGSTKLVASSSNVEWSSSNTKVATVDNNGNVTAKGTGSAIITVKDLSNGTTDTCTIDVSYAWWQWVIKIVLFGWIWY